MDPFRIPPRGAGINKNKPPVPSTETTEPMSGSTQPIQTNAPQYTPPPITDEERRNAELARIENAPITDSLATPSDVTAPVATSTGLAVAPKKSHKKAIIISAILAVLLLGGASAWAYTAYVVQNPQRVMMDALNHYISSTHTQHALDLSAATPIGDDKSVQFKKIRFTANVAPGPVFDGDAEVTLQYEKETFNLKAKAIFTKSGDLYYQLNDLDDIVKTLMVVGGSSEELPVATKKALQETSNKWIKVAAKDIASVDEDLAASYQCVVDTFKKHKDDKEIQTIYENNQFLTVKEKLPVKDGNIGYKVAIDKEKSEAFDKAVENTAMGKELKKCAEKMKDDKNESVDSENPVVNTTLWIGEWNHQLKKVEFDATHKNTETKKDEKLVGTLDIAYDTSVKPMDTPKEAMTLEEWTQEIMTTIMSQGTAGGAQELPSTRES